MTWPNTSWAGKHPLTSGHSQIPYLRQIAKYALSDESKIGVPIGASVIAQNLSSNKQQRE